MNRKVLGKNVIFAMLVDGNYYPLFCGKTAELVLDQDEIEVTHVNSGAARDFVPGMSGSIFNVAGVTLINNDEHKVSLLYLSQLAIRRSINTYRVLLTDQDGTLASIIFSAFIRNTTLSRDVLQWSQSVASFRITGDWAFSSVIPSPTIPTCEEEDPIFTTLAEGSTEITSVLLQQGGGETITILHVSRSGTTYYQTSGTPGNLEFQYDNVGGKIKFQWGGNPAAPNLEPVSVNYKIEV